MAAPPMTHVGEATMASKSMKRAASAVKAGKSMEPTASAVKSSKPTTMKPTAPAVKPTAAAEAPSGKCRDVRHDAKRTHRYARRQNSYHSLLHGTFPTQKALSRRSRRVRPGHGT